MIATAKIKTQTMQQATTDDFSNATELADYLATKGIPFRQAHAIVGKLVLKGLKTGVNLQDIPLAEYQKIMPDIGTEIYHDLQARIAVQRRQSLGGTSFQQVRQQIAEAQQILKNS